MDSLALYAALRREIAAVKAQSDRISAKIAPATINASDIHDGVRTNAFEVWFTRIRMLWDASDAAIDLTARDYGFPAEKLARWGVDPAKLQASLTERDRAKVIEFWRADKADGAFAPATGLGDLRAAMIAARQFAIDNYPTGAGGEDQGLTIGADGERVPVVFDAGKMTGLQPLLGTVSDKCAALLP